MRYTQANVAPTSGAHAIQRELEHLLRPLGREEGVHDLANRDQLAKADVAAALVAPTPFHGVR